MTDTKCSIYQNVHIPGCMGCAVNGHRQGCTCTGWGVKAGGIDANTEPQHLTPAEVERQSNRWLRASQPPKLAPFTVVPDVER